MKDTIKLGSLITDKQHRDAIHIAVVPIVAGQDLEPGAHVGLSESGQAIYGLDSIGVIDPFLTERVAKGQTCWLLLYPGTITSLRHNWTHPAFADEQQAVAKTMFDTRTNFLLAIAANPLDQSLRSVFADWLEENGQEDDAKKQREWTHHKAASEQWLRIFASENRGDYEEMIYGAVSGEGYCFGEEDGPQHVRDNREFWHHIENVTGKRLDNEHRENTFFRCSC